MTLPRQSALRRTAFVTFALAASLTAAAPASARIACQGIYQQGKYGPFVSPYCSEQEIARVARSYGERVSDAEVHQNANTKVRLCMRFGGDNRLKGACGAYNPRNIRP